MTLSSILITIIIVVISVNVISGHRRHPHTTTTTTPRPRFPHLDRILNRLDEERYRTTVAPTVQWHSEGLDPSAWYKLQQSAWQYPELHQFLAADSTHGMLRDDWMPDEDDDSEEDDTRDFGKQQRDEAAVGGSAISRFKWQSLGTRQDVARTRTRQMASEKEFQAALQHAVRILETGQCQQPRPRVVCASDVYPHPSKTYIPRCTVLHQCGDDTGCCKYESETCVAKTSHAVELPFFTSTVGSKPRNPSNSGASVERLLFYNHTECECLDREQRDNAGRHQAAAAASVPAVPDPRHYMRLPKPRRSPEEDKGCKCPTEYSVRQLDNGTCVCDCFDRQRECLRFKKGKHSFSLTDRNCVLNRECREPACEFGAYISRAGRCPIKWEQYGMTFHEPVAPPELVHKTVSEHKPPEPHHSKPTSEVIKPVQHWSETKPWTSETHNKPSIPSWVSSSDTRPVSSHFPSWNPSPPISSASQTKTWPDTSRSIPVSSVQSKTWSSSSSTDTRPSWSASNTEHKFPWLESKPTEHKYPWLESRSSDHGKTSQQRHVPAAPAATDHKYPWLAPRATEQRPSTYGRLWGSTTESQPRFPWNPSDSSRPKPSSWLPARSSRDTRARGS